MSKNIHPRFCLNDMTQSVSLIKGITFEQAFLLMAAVRNNMLKPWSCWSGFYMHLEMNEDQSRGCGLRYDDLKITSDFENMNMGCVGAKNMPSTPAERMQLCRDNLAAGRCKCETMRNTFGAVLFPQHYVNLKQRQK